MAGGVSSAHGQQRFDGASQRFLRGVMLAEQHETQAAIAVFAALVDKHPEWPEPANNVGVVYARTGDFRQARRWLEVAVKARPGYALAQRNLNSVNTALAAITYNKALNDPAKHRPTKLADDLELDARLHIVAAKPAAPVHGQAADVGSYQAQRAGASPRRARARATALHNQAKTPTSDAGLATPTPKTVDDWLNQGYAALDRKDQAAAMTAFVQASQLAPDSPEIWKNIGYLNLDIGHKAAALKDFQRASQLAPEDAEVWKNIGYLDLATGDKTGALQAFEQARKYKPGDVEIWTNLGYLQAGGGDKSAALASFLQAQKLKPGDNLIAMEIAYLQTDLGHPKAARRQFETVTRRASSGTMRQQACSGAHDAASASTKLLANPNFGDVYFAPSYENTRFRDGVFPFKARLGHHFGEHNRGSVYGFVSAQDDTGSSGGQQPSILNDNALVVGVGADYRPVDAWPVTVYVEGGYGYDLTDRNRARSRFSYDLGITGYQSWGMPPPQCSDQTQWLWKPYADVYGNVEYDTRQDRNTFLQFRPRFGLTVADGRWGSARTYVKLNMLADAKGYYYNNLFEYGPGIAWQTHTTIPIVLRAEYLWGRYTRNASGSPKGSSYHGPRYELDFYWAF